MPRAKAVHIPFRRRKPAYVALTRPPIPKPYRIQVRKPDKIRIIDTRSKAVLRVIKTPGVIRSVWCGATRGMRERSFTGIWVAFDDERTAIYSAKTGRLICEKPDPCKNSKVQAEINAVQARLDDPVRYAVVSPLAKTTSSFFDFSTGLWESNPTRPGVAIKDREVAQAAASVLSKQRRQRGKRSVILGGGSKPLQTVAFRRTPKGVRFLNEVTNGYQRFVPSLSRHVRAQINVHPETTAP